MTKWEYGVYRSLNKTVDDDIPFLDNFGKGGWELVNAIFRNEVVYYYFKRPLPLTKEDLGPYQIR